MYECGEFIVSIRNELLRKDLSGQGFLKSPSFMLFAILKGGSKIEKRTNKFKIKQYDDLTNLPSHRVYSVKKMIKCLVERNKDDLSIYFLNLDFYRDIIIEICYVLYFFQSKNYTSSFVHVYRVLERMSFCLPLLYVQNTKDFRKSYKELMAFFKATDPKAGELGFFKVALKDMLGEIELRYKFDFKISAQEGLALDSILKCDKTKSDDFMYFNLSIRDTISFIINIRNIFFHALSGGNNISLDKLYNPDFLFQKILPNFINVLCYLLGFVLDKNFSIDR